MFYFSIKSNLNKLILETPDFNELTCHHSETALVADQDFYNSKHFVNATNPGIHSMCSFARYLSCLLSLKAQPLMTPQSNDSMISAKTALITGITGQDGA